MCQCCSQNLKTIKEELRTELQAHLEEILITLLRHNESLSADLEIQLNQALKNNS